MAVMAKLATLVAMSALAGCAAIRQFPSPGDSTEQVIAKMGHPNAVYPEGSGQEFEYTAQPMGEFCWMAHMGPDGRLLSFEQVLTGAKFATIPIGHANKADVLRTIGRPAEQSRVRLHNYEVWSYRYKEAGAWNSLMHVHFDEQGVVRQMMNGPDPMFEVRDRRW